MKKNYQKIFLFMAVLMLALSLGACRSRTDSIRSAALCSADIHQKDLAIQDISDFILVDDEHKSIESTPDIFLFSRYHYANYMATNRIFHSLPEGQVLNILFLFSLQEIDDLSIGEEMYQHLRFSIMNFKQTFQQSDLEACLVETGWDELLSACPDLEEIEYYEIKDALIQRIDTHNFSVHMAKNTTLLGPVEVQFTVNYAQENFDIEYPKIATQCEIQLYSGDYCGSCPKGYLSKNVTEGDSWGCDLECQKCGVYDAEGTQLEAIEVLDESFNSEPARREFCAIEGNHDMVIDLR